MTFLTVSMLSAPQISIEPIIFLGAEGVASCQMRISGAGAGWRNYQLCSQETMASDSGVRRGPPILIKPDLYKSSALSRCVGRTERRRWKASWSVISGAQTKNLCRLDAEVVEMDRARRTCHEIGQIEVRKWYMTVGETGRTATGPSPWSEF